MYDANPSDLYTVLMSPYDMDGLGGDVEEDGLRMGAYMGQQQIYGIPGTPKIRKETPLIFLRSNRDQNAHYR